VCWALKKQVFQLKKIQLNCVFTSADGAAKPIMEVHAWAAALMYIELCGSSFFVQLRGVVEQANVCIETVNIHLLLSCMTKESALLHFAQMLAFVYIAKWRHCSRSGSCASTVCQSAVAAERSDFCIGLHANLHKINGS
jgi:hypothetical protein